MTAASARPRVGLATLVLSLALGAGCGEDDEAGSGAKPVGLSSGGSVVQFVDCADWKRATPDERHATIDALRGQLTPQRSATARSPLSDERAYDIFQSACKPGYASRLRLYKLYVRAQGFAPLSE